MAISHSNSDLSSGTEKSGSAASDSEKLFEKLIKSGVNRRGKPKMTKDHYRLLVEFVPQQIWTAGPNGEIDYGNARIFEYFGDVTESVLTGNEWRRYLHPEDRSRTIERWMHSIGTGTVYENEIRLRRHDGEFRWHLVQARPMRGGDGRIVKWFGTNTDIHERRLAEEALRQSKEYQNLFQHANDAILILDPETEIVLNANDRACEIYGLPREKFIGRSIKDLSANARRGEAQIGELLLGGAHEEFESVQFRADGSPVHFLINSSIIEFDGRPAVLSINRDITERKRIEENLRRNFSLLNSTLEATADGILAVDAAGRVMIANRKFAEMWGLPEDYFQTHDAALPPESVINQLVNPADFLENLKRLENDQVHDAFDVLELKDGRIYERHSKPQILDGRVTGRVFSFRDVTERRRAEERLRHHALHDQLTGLPNRTLFLEHLRRAVERRSERAFAVLFLDFDQFKIINDSLGHMEGDRLLRLIGERLARSVRAGDIVARLGGDEFTVLLDDLDAPRDAVEITERIHRDLRQPFELGGRSHLITASIGIAVSRGEYRQAEEMLRDADIAMYQAKARGKARHQTFDRSMHERASRRLHLEMELRRAVENEEFTVYYQPIVDLETGRIVGFESLARWAHPTRGLVQPAEFIPLAEETGLIIPLGQWVMRESCRQMREWQRREVEAASGALKISVNLSSRQFAQPDLVEQVDSVLRETGLDARCLKLEITESQVMENSALGKVMMDHLRAIGVELSLDDFGTGYSSLSYLHRLPATYLKVDRSFISRMTESDENYEIVHTIIRLAQSLKMKIIAEGIETGEQKAVLQELGCDFGQGFLFSKPVSAEVAGGLITKDNSFPDYCAYRPVH